MWKSEWNEERFSFLLRALSSQTNLRILILLSNGEFSTGELARFLGKDETDISRRLKYFRELGLVNYRWVRVAGKNVKYYRLSTSPIRIVIDKGDISIVGSSEKTLYVFPVDNILWRYPQTGFFVGRKEELDVLRRLRPGEMLVITGLPGSGKTYLVAHYLGTEKTGNVFWHTISSSDCIESFLRRLALFLSSYGYTLLQEYFSSHWFELETAGELALEGLEKTGVFLVLDDYHRLEDHRITELLRKYLDRMSRTRIIIISRRRPRLPASHPRIKYLRLEGLGVKDSRVFMEKTLKKRVSPKLLAEIMATLHGHPLLMKWFSSIARDKGLSTAMGLLMKGNVTEGFWREIYNSLSPQERLVISRIACLGGLVKKDFVELVVRSQAEEKALYDLLDNNLLLETDTHIVVSEIVYTLISRHRVRAGCRELVDNYIEALTSSPVIENYIEAFKTVVETGFYEKIRGLVDYRIKSISYRILDYIEPYKRILETALTGRLEPYIKALVLEELAMIYITVGRFDEARELVMKALPYLEREGSRELLALTLSRMILLDEERALEYAEKALSIANEIKGDAFRNLVLSHIYANISRYYASKNMWDKAYEYMMLEVKHSSLSGDPVDKAFSEFHKLIIQSILEEDLDPREIKRIREIMEFYGARNYSILVAMYEALAYIIRGDYKAADSLTRRYIRENLRFKNLPPPCELYSILYIISVLKRTRLPYKRLEKTCFSPEQISCFALLTDMMTRGVDNGSLELAKKKCSYLDIIYLERIFRDHKELGDKLQVIKEKIGFSE